MSWSSRPESPLCPEPSGIMFGEVPVLDAGSLEPRGGQSLQVFVLESLFPAGQFGF